MTPTTSPGHLETVPPAARAPAPTHLLHLVASARGQASFSTRFSDRIVERLCASAPDVIVTRRELGAEGLEHVDATYGNTLAGLPLGDTTVAATGSLARSEQLIRELEAADAVVIGTPVHNYTVPSVLKAWIDHVLRAHRSFALTSDGKRGLLADRPVYIAVASGGRFSGEGLRQPDFLKPYLEVVFQTIGIRSLRFITLECTVFGDEAVAASLAQAEQSLERHLSAPAAVA